MLFSHGDDGVDLEVADGDDDERQEEDLAVHQEAGPIFCNEIE